MEARPPDQPGSSRAPAAAATTQEERQYLWDKRCRALHRSTLSNLYHRKRERLLALADRGASAVALIAGTAAFSELLPTAGQKAIAGVVVAVVTLPGLVFGWGECSRRHAALAARFKNVEAEIVGKGERDYTEEDIRQWERQLRIIEADEPPTLSTLVHQCQIELDVAMGLNPGRLPLWKRALMHFFDMSAKPTSAK